MNITLYSTHCPQCKVLETKLNQKGIKFTLEDNTQKVVAAGREHNIMGAPILDVDGKFMNFSEAIKWLNGTAVEECEACKF